MIGNEGLAKERRNTTGVGVTTVERLRAIGEVLEGGNVIGVRSQAHRK